MKIVDPSLEVNPPRSSVIGNRVQTLGASIGSPHRTGQSVIGAPTLTREWCHAHAR